MSTDWPSTPTDENDPDEYIPAWFIGLVEGTVGKMVDEGLIELREVEYTWTDELGNEHPVSYVWQDTGGES